MYQVSKKGFSQAKPLRELTAKEFADYLEKHLATDINLFDFSNQQLQQYHALTLANILMNNTTITKVDLSRNMLGDSGITALANALKNNSSIEWVDLSNNKITSNGISAIADMLKYNKSITYLDLSGFKIYQHENKANDSIAMLLEALKSNNSLSALYLGNKDFGDPYGGDSRLTVGDLINIRRLLDINQSLTKIYFVTYAYGDEDKPAIERLKIEIEEKLSNNRIKKAVIEHNRHAQVSKLLQQQSQMEIYFKQQNQVIAQLQEEINSLKKQQKLLEGIIEQQGKELNALKEKHTYLAIESNECFHRIEERLNKFKADEKNPSPPAVPNILQEHAKAATKIQAVFRGFRIRQQKPLSLLSQECQQQIMKIGPDMIGNLAKQ